MLEELGYQVITSTPGNLLPASQTLRRYDLDISFLDWKNGRSSQKTIEELEQEFDHYRSYKDNIVIALSYTDMTDTSVLRELVSYMQAKDTEFMSIASLDRWRSFRSAVVFSAVNSSVRLTLPPDVRQLDGLTLVLEQSGNYTLATNYAGLLYLHNRNSREIVVCLNMLCTTIPARHVIEAPDGII